MRSLYLLAGLGLCVLTSCDNLEEGSTVFTKEEQAILAAEFEASFWEAGIPEYTDPDELPIHFKRFGFGTQSHEMDREVHLGRALFYDVRLSQDNSVSCASCHQPERGFADNKALSTGISGRATERNSQSINNIRAYYGDAGSGFFWDSRAQSLEEQAEESMSNEVEMGMSLSDVHERLLAIPAYQVLFATTYPNNGGLTEANITRSLAAFARNISSTSSRFDVALNTELSGKSPEGLGFSDELVRPAFPTFTEAENRGKSIYLNDCAGCHSSQLPTLLEPHNNGVYAVGEHADKGVGAFDAAKDGWFKTPQLRNVALTAPYMHDGSMATLEDVVEHYSSGIKPEANLSNALRGLDRLDNGKLGFNYSDEDKQALLAFLHTLTDDQLASRQELANPFLR